MKKIAMLLCLILALGWISDTGMLSLKIGNECIRGIQTEVGYTYTISYNGWKTEFTPFPIAATIRLGWTPIVIVNKQQSRLTRLGNGWLFSFVEREVPNASRLPNR